MRNPELWARLRAYAFDAPGSAPFSVKLATAEGWSPSYTGDVIEEYRRFLYLTQVSDTKVTPSRAVDAAWHLHMTYTRAYWDDLCGTVIGQPIHHEPCAGEEDMPRYRDQFEHTRLLYEAEFGAPPPRDVWGGGKGNGAKRGPSWRRSGDTLLWVAVASCIGLYIAFDLHWIVYVLIMGMAFALGWVLNDESSKRRRKRDDEDWFDADFDFERGSGRRGRDDDDRDGDGGDGGGCGGD